MPYYKSRKTLDFIFVVVLLFTVIYNVLHLILIDISNVILTISNLDFLIDVNDSFYGIGQISLLIVAGLFLFLGICYIFLYDRNSKFNWRDIFLSITLIAMITCSLFSILVVYDFFRLFISIYPLDNTILFGVYFVRLMIIALFVVSLIVISIGTFYLSILHFKDRTNDNLIIIIPGVLIAIFHIVGIFLIFRFY